MILEGFIGPSNTLRSSNADAERTVNLFLEQTAPGKGKVPAYLTSTPGLRPWIGLPTSPIRSLFEQDGRAYAVAGGAFYELGSNQSIIASGAVADGTSPAWMCSNGTAGNQVAFAASGLGYIYDTLTNTLTQITADGFPNPCKMIEFIDGYFIGLLQDSREFAISELESGLEWEATEFAQRSIGSDNINGIIRNHRELWLIGTHTSEVWVNNGDPDFPFAPLQGTLIEQGTFAGWGVQRLDNTLIFPGKDTQGSGIVWRANGYTPERISTHAVELALQKVSLPSDNDANRAIGWTYQENGHLFYLLILPDSETTWVFDVASGLWHERARWNSTDCVWVPHVAACHMYAFGKHLVGDRQSGTIYEQILEPGNDSFITSSGL